MKLSINDFDNICRLCLRNVRNISQESKETANYDSTINDNIIQMILDCVNIMILKNDGFPQRLCTSCLNKLSFSYKFRKRCLKSNMILKNIKDMDLGGSESSFDVELYGDNLKPLAVSVTSSRDSNNVFWENIKNSPGSDNQRYTNVDDESTESVTIITSVAEKTIILPDEHVGSKDIEDNSSIQSSKFHYKKKSLKKVLCPICGILTLDLNQHTTMHREKEFKCEICGKAFAQRVNYKRHVFIHTGNKPFKCELCDKSFASAIYLKSHTITHTKERNYQCDLCGKSFGYPRVLAAHKRSHAQDRKISCSCCQKMFLTKSGLKKHMRIHTGEKPYKCEFCTKRFTSSYNMKSHRRVHTKERPFKCLICDMDFSFRSVLNMHTKKVHLVDDK